MSSSGIGRSMLAKYDAWVTKVKEAHDDAVAAAAKKIMPDVISTMKKCYERAANQFYADYNQEFYERTGSLKKIFVIKEIKNKNGEVTGAKPDWDAARDNMRLDRRGHNTLFDLIVYDGYHGGASEGDTTKITTGRWAGLELNTPHPGKGTPYWRTPEKSYLAWGRPAVQTTSPYDLYFEFLNEEKPRIYEKYSDYLIEEFEKRYKNI